MNILSKSTRHFAVDFDGTIAEQVPEWKEYHYGDLPTGPNFGPILPWFKRFLPQAIKEGHSVTVFTARDFFQHPAISQYIEVETGYSIPVTSTKLKCFDLFIDDRAVRFHGKEPENWEFSLEPWWKS